MLLTDTTTHTYQLAKRVVVCYFTDRPPFLQDFRHWVEIEMHAKNGWRLNHTQYAVKNFFLIEFDQVEDKDAALELPPGFLEENSSTHSHGTPILM